MGNRAVITTKEKTLAVYVHWNGGRDSVEGFLKFCELSQFRPPERDCYGWARLVATIANFFGGGGLSVGIDLFERLAGSADYDNGVYIIKNWRIVDRERNRHPEQTEYSLRDMLEAINDAQPKACRLAEETIEEATR